MPFPQGGDFSHSVSGLFKIVKTDRRICVHDNGTSICNAGYKLKFPGTCVNQVIGTFNSTDPTFQPTFPICLVDYKSIGFSNGLVFTSEDPEASTFTVSDDGIDSEHWISQLSTSITGHFSVYKFLDNIVGSSLIFSVDPIKQTAFYPILAPSIILSSCRLAQLNPGAIYPGAGVFSPLFVYDVYNNFSIVNGYSFYFLETLAASLKQEDLFRSYKNLIGYDATISGSEDICIGDGVPPYVVLHNPSVSGTHLAPTNQIVDLSIGDAVAGVDISKVSLQLYSETRFPGSHYNLVVGGADATGGRVAISGDQREYRFIFTPIWTWDNNEYVRITISGNDLPPIVGGNPFFCGANTTNTLLGEIWFQVFDKFDLPASLTAIGDLEAPYISYTFPASGTGSNNVFNAITFKIADSFTGVDLTTLDVSVDGTVIVNNGSPTTSETSITGGPAEYTVSYDPISPFQYGSVIEVHVFVKDLYVYGANTLDTSYTISYIADTSMRVENFLPEVGVSSQLDSLNIQVDVFDDTYGVNTSSTDLIINGEAVFATQQILTSGVRLTYHPPNNFDFGEPINVIVHGVNLNNNAPVVIDAPFVLYYGYRFLQNNSSPFQHNSQVNVFVQAKNVKRFNKYLNTSYYFTTYQQPSKDISAEIEAIVPWRDLGAEIGVIAPTHSYGQTITVEVYVKDFDGNELGPYTFSYKIEDQPS